jgi:hypothetical protein
VAMASDGPPLTRLYSTIAKSFYSKIGEKWCPCVLLVPVRSGMGRCDVIAGVVGDRLMMLARQRESLAPKG